MAPPTTISHRWTSNERANASEGENLELANYMPKLDSSLTSTQSGACSACGVLEEQVRRALAQADAAQQQAELAQGAAVEAEAASLASTRAVAELRAERDTEPRLQATVRRGVDERRHLREAARARWEEEASAWQELCADNWAAAETTRCRFLRAEAQHESELVVASELRQALETTLAEVSRLHALQSSVEAQRLQDAESASAEARRLNSEESEARAREHGGMKSRAAAAEELGMVRNETVHSETLHAQCRQQRRILEAEVAAAREDAQSVKWECDEVSQSCRIVVGRINGGQDCGDQDIIGETKGLRFEREQEIQQIFPARDNATLELERELQQLLMRSSQLEAQNQRSEDARRTDAETQWTVIEQVRRQVARYRASCKELQRLTNVDVTL